MNAKVKPLFIPHRGYVVTYSLPAEPGTTIDLCWECSEIWRDRLGPCGLPSAGRARPGQCEHCNLNRAAEHETNHAHRLTPTTKAN